MINIKIPFLRSLCSLVLLLGLTLGVMPGATMNAAYAQANSEQINVAVLNLEGPEVDAQLLATLTSVLRNEAQQYASYDVVNQSPINLSEVAIVLGCATEELDCLARAAEQLAARVLIYGRVKKTDPTYQVTVEVFDASSKEITRRLVRTLETSEGDPVVAFREGVQTLFRTSPTAGAAKNATLLQIDATVEDAEIKLNGVMIGRAPIERSGLPADTYQIEVLAEGYQPWVTSVELSPGADARILARLVPTDEPGRDPGALATRRPATASPTPTLPPPPKDTAAGPNWGAWSAIGVGGAALVGSGVMALMMQSAEDDLQQLDANRDTQPRDAYLTERQNIVDNGESYQLAHRVLLGVGAVSVVAGTVWLLLDTGAGETPDSRADADAVDLEVGLAPDGVSASWRW